MSKLSPFWKALLLFVCCLGLGDNVSVAGQTPPMVHVGAGAQSCGEWVTVQEKSPKNDVDTLKASMLLSWVQGYVVGSAEALTTLVSGNKVPTLAASQARYGTVSGWVYDPPDPEATKHWITKYCKENPLSHLTEASMGLVAELFTRTK